MEIMIKRFFTFFLVGVFSLFLAFWLSNLVPIYLVILSIFIMVALITYFMPFLVKVYLKGKTYDGEYAKELIAFAKSQNINLNYLLVAPGKYSNAHAMGCFNNTGVVFYSVTLEKHPKGEIFGVMAHEIGHIKNGDAFITAPLIAFIFSMIVVVNHKLVVYLDLKFIGILFLILMETSVFLLLILAINRWREHLADKTAKSILEDPTSFARFLKRMMDIYQKDGVSFPNNPPLILKLINTHPLIFDRMEYLNAKSA